MGVLTLLFQQFGIPVVQEDLEGFVKVASAIIALVLVFWGRLRLEGSISSVFVNSNYPQSLLVIVRVALNAGR